MNDYLGEWHGTDEMGADLSRRFEHYRERLQDTSKRNPLVNFTDRKASTLRVLDPGIGVVWQSITNGKSITFPRPQQGISLVDGEDKSSSVKAAQAAETRERNRREAERLQRDNWLTPKRSGPIKPDAVTTDKTRLQTNRILRNLSRKARTSIEEQGVNILYLGFGLLRYEDTDSNRKILEAPLVMVPVKIEAAGAASPYVISASDDDPLLNPTIRYLLQESYGVSLPDYEDVGDLREYFDQVKASIHRYRSWSVQDEVVLGVFQFQKLSMFYDLEARKTDILANPVVRSILGDVHALDGLEVPSVEREDHDSVPLADNLEIIDADSSQEDAISLARRGTSFVLQGPPGTGKSQTITNIIADFIGRGKTVLFVSEKRAALDVVYDKLRQANLDDFSLVLHGTKASKKAVLEELMRTLELAGQSLNLSPDAQTIMSKTEEDRRQLDGYANDISEVIQPLGISLFEGNARLARLVQQDAPNIRFPIDAVSKVDRESLEERCNWLEEYVRARRSLGADPEDCPWRGFVLDAVPYQTREELGDRSRVLAAKIDHLWANAERLTNEFGIVAGGSLKEIRETAGHLEGLSGGTDIPAEWDSPKKLAALEEQLAAQVASFSAWQDACGVFDQALAKAKEALPDTALTEMDAALCPRTSEELADALKIIDGTLDEFAALDSWKTMGDAEWDSAIARLQAVQSQYQAASGLVQERYLREAFDFDFKPIEARYKTDYDSFFKRLGKQHREDLRALGALCRTLDTKLRDDQARAVLSDLRALDDARATVSDFDSEGARVFSVLYRGAETDIEELQRKRQQLLVLVDLRNSTKPLQSVIEQHEESEEQVSGAFGWLYTGWDTDWQGAVQPAIDWARELLTQLHAIDFRAHRDWAKLCTEADARRSCEDLAASLVSSSDDVAGDIAWFGEFFGEDGLDGANLLSIRDRSMACSENLDQLEAWIDFRDANSACALCGLTGDVLETLCENLDPRSTDPELFAMVYRRRFYTLWLDECMRQRAFASKFRADAQNRKIAEYRELDVKNFTITRMRIRSGLLERLPSLGITRGAGRGEVGVLIHEANKKRRIMPLRKLFGEIPELIQSLKPCMMMSPLAVSTFLQDAHFDFDLVVFDEASQVRTEDAIGAISRGRQTIIAGDAKQLPPTNFFNAVSQGSDEYDEDDDSGAFESVLEEASMLPTLTLKWHYRSRSEDLIAFSNERLYDGKLITFPSSYIATPDRGVEFVYVPEGVYEQGSSKANPIEAKRVADLVFAHFRKYGKRRSLGVIAFGDRQATAIEDAINQRRIQDPSYESYFSEDDVAPFFVKNLENVQGDERDTIILSVGYGKGKNGKLSLNFGPLTLAGGERRLNVAVTRAKVNLKLVSSIDASDIDVSNVTNLGPKLLRDYLQYAKTRTLGAPSASGGQPEFSSDFEKVLYDALVREGYSVDTKIGNSDYRVDLAVRDPARPARYLMGIESDGHEYCSARTARERDRLREQVLTNMGWKMHRVWSTNWIKNEQVAEHSLLDALKSATEESNNAGLDAAEKPMTPETTGLHDADGQQTQERKEKPLQSSWQDAPRDEKGVNASRYKAEAVVQERLRLADSNPYGFKEYLSYRFRRQVGDGSPTNFIIHLVALESPVSEEVLMRKVMDACYPNARKLTESLRREISAAAAMAQSKGKVVRTVAQSGLKFYLSPAQATVEPREGNGRGVNDIYDAEYQAGMLRVLEELFGATKDEVLYEVMNAFGFRRMTPLLSDTLDRVYNQLIHSGKIVESGDKVFVAAR